MIHLVVALPAEAAPLVEQFGLRRAASGHHPGIYLGDAMRLVVSGVGKAAAGGTTAGLRRSFGQADAFWVNLGIGAHRDLPIGELVTASEVLDGATGKSWALTPLGVPEIAAASVCTVDRPQRNLDDERVYEMEAAGFVATVLQWAAVERVACLKVISDHGVESPGALTRQAVSELMQRNLDRIESALQSLR